ncbi:protein cueball [Tribolium madens]|uniref:protein cueball n=1 Tax=Tribolium madens TaxID=41895 RepID=UPI001CF758FA|nr:protein cueball [Tribolium madens]
MFIKLSVIISILHLTIAQTENHDWELAVVTNDKIELLLSNGSIIGSAFEQFNKLKALTFDNIRHQFVVSDMDQQNDTIFSVQLTKETDVTSIIEDLPDDVQGLAIDPISDILYWTDSINKTINYVRLNESAYKSNILFAFTDENPQDITIDVCRRYIYWTNSDINKPTIERARLDGSHHEILVDAGLHRPAGISIDYKTQRLYWADIKEGIYYSIESTNLEGKEREVVYEGTHSKPFGVAVDSDAVYWTDINNNVLWKIPKHDKDSVPERLRHFKEKPMGIIAKNVQITSFPDCEELSKAISSYNKTVEEIFKRVSQESEETEEVICLNGGFLVDDKFCHCPRGYAGKFCEISLCYNYCVHGECYASSLGYPQCHCLKGFGGKRCNRDMCDGFCLNGGVCKRGGELPICECQEGFTGRRCESTLDICEVFCQDRQNDVLITQKEVVCRCVDGYPDVVQSNFSSLPLLLSQEEHPDFFDHFQDTAFLVLCCLVFILMVVSVVLATYACSLRRRPRIKKRIIVNKNFTQLTNRPRASEQCEITIENCCNMNICETPCFEPPQLPCLQNKNDDKKKLLSNMENGEELC